MIFENNEEIDKLVHFLDQKVVEFRHKYPNQSIIPEIAKFYKNVVIPWQEKYHLDHIEPSDETDEQIKNQILDLMHILISLLELAKPNDKK